MRVWRFLWTFPSYLTTSCQSWSQYRLHDHLGNQPLPVRWPRLYQSLTSYESRDNSRSNQGQSTNKKRKPACLAPEQSTPPVGGNRLLADGFWYRTALPVTRTPPTMDQLRITWQFSSNQGQSTNKKRKPACTTPEPSTSSVWGNRLLADRFRYRTDRENPSPSR